MIIFLLGYVGFSVSDVVVWINYVEKFLGFMLVE